VLLVLACDLCLCSRGRSNRNRQVRTPRPSPSQLGPRGLVRARPEGQGQPEWAATEAPALPWEAVYRPLVLPAGAAGQLPSPEPALLLPRGRLHLPSSKPFSVLVSGTKRRLVGLGLSLRI
jgi:hypothetical protein